MHSYLTTLRRLDLERDLQPLQLPHRIVCIPERSIAVGSPHESSSSQKKIQKKFHCTVYFFVSLVRLDLINNFSGKRTHQVSFVSISLLFRSVVLVKI